MTRQKTMTRQRNAPVASAEAKRLEQERKDNGAVQLWDFYRVKIEIRDKLIGGWPKSPQVVEALLRARGLEDLIPIRDYNLENLTPEEKEELKKNAIEKSWVGFLENDNGPYLESRCVKAMLKEAANVLKSILDVKNLKSKVAERVFVDPYQIYLGKDKVDGTGERVIHVMTMQGPRSSIKKYDYMLQPEINFRLRVLRDNLVKESMLRTMLEYAQENGLGTDRSQDHGKFDLIEFEKI
mgnify:FL=1